MIFSRSGSIRLKWIESYNKHTWCLGLTEERWKPGLDCNRNTDINLPWSAKGLSSTKTGLTGLKYRTERHQYRVLYKSK